MPNVSIDNVTEVGGNNKYAEYPTCFLCELQDSNFRQKKGRRERE
jgi:hypothetical protein